MRRITLWLFSTVAALVLLFSYRTSTGGSVTAANVAAAAAAVDGKTFTGTAVSTRWGDVQVAIVVADGKIVDVQVPVYPTENRKDREINDRALPVLRRETLDAQSADIDAVSGATVTSNGYVQSLQSALDAAHLG